MADRRRWGRSFAIALGLHASVAALAIVGWKTAPLVLAAPPPAILIDMQPTPPALPQPKAAEEKVEPKPLPVVEKAEAVIQKPKPKPRPEKERPPKPAPAVVPNVQPAPAAPQLAQSPVEARPAVAPDYLSVLFAHMERYTRYPRGGGWRKPEGTVLLRIRFDRKGHVLSSRVVKSSGFELLDDAALATVRRADPLPPFPDTMPQQNMTLNIPVHFSVKE